MRRVDLIRIMLSSLLAVMCAAFAFAEEDYTAEDYLSRMFVSPNGQTLPSGVMNFAFGGSFASQGGKEYLGLISIGMGNIAEFEISTAHIITNIISDSEPIGTTSLKFILYSEKKTSPIPPLVLTLRSNSWSRFSADEGDLAGPAEDYPGGNVYNVDFDVHQTSLFLSTTKILYPTYKVHGGFVFHEFRVRDIEFYGSGNVSRTLKNTKKGVFGVFAGLEHEINETTHSILEFGSKPRIEFDNVLESVGTDNLYYMVAGVRFFLTQMTSLDAAIRYRSDYSGLSDAEIRTGLNIGLDIRKAYKEKLLRR